MSEHTGLAVIMILFGLPAAVFPYKIAKFREALDAIGSKRPGGEVEPAGWNVLFTRIVGVGMILFGGLVYAGLVF